MRVLTLRDALAIGVGATIGPGIFTVIAPLAGTAGSLAPLAFIFTGFSLLFSVLAHARLASTFPSTGGLYVFVKRAFGTAGGFFIGWSFCLSAAAAGAFVALGFADYLGIFIPTSRLWAGLAVICFYLLLNLIGIRSVVFVQKVFTAATLSIVSLVILSGFLQGKVLPQQVELPPPKMLLQGSLLTFTLFAGFEVVGSMAGEVRNPKRTLPMAMLATLLIAIFVYTAVTTVALATQKPAELAGSLIPLAEVAQYLLGLKGSYIVAAGVLLGSMSVINAQILVISRIMSAMAGDGILPMSLVDFKISTTLASVLLAGIMFGFPSVGMLAQISSFFFVLMLISTNMAYIKMFKPQSLSQTVFAACLFLPVLSLAGVRLDALSLVLAWLMAGGLILAINRAKVRHRSAISE
jgi:APA family basic amino acid/polyamine antiporter